MTGPDLAGLANARHDAACLAFYGHPAGGAVYAEDEGFQWRIAKGSGELSVERRNRTLVERVEHGPGGWAGTRIHLVKGPTGATLSDREQVPADTLLSEFARALGRLEFSAGERGVAVRCSLCDGPPDHPDLTGHFALCERHHQDWLDPDIGQRWGFSQFILRELGLWERASGSGPDAGNWEGIMAATGHSARNPTRPSCN